MTSLVFTASLAVIAGLLLACGDDVVSAGESSTVSDSEDSTQTGDEPPSPSDPIAPLPELRPLDCDLAEHPLPVDIGSAVAAGDFDGDGHTDLLTVEREDWGPATLRVWLGDGAGGLSPGAGLLLEHSLSVNPGFIVGDVDGDGIDEFAYHDHSRGRYGGVWVHEFEAGGVAPGTFTEIATLWGFRRLIDTNGDGLADLSFGGYHSSPRSRPGGRRGSSPPPEATRARPAGSRDRPPLSPRPAWVMTGGDDRQGSGVLHHAKAPSVEDAIEGPLVDPLDRLALLRDSKNDPPIIEHDPDGPAPALRRRASELLARQHQEVAPPEVEEPPQSSVHADPAHPQHPVRLHRQVEHLPLPSVLLHVQLGQQLSALLSGPSPQHVAADHHDHPQQPNRRGVGRVRDHQADEQPERNKEYPHHHHSRAIPPGTRQRLSPALQLRGDLIDFLRRGRADLPGDAIVSDHRGRA
ncbi:MAG: VCBS repeat-containing protein [Enhygromyxa sp.]